MNFKKVNNLTGWAVFLISLATYMLTREARGSLWDCGEFVATAKNLGLPHPPGAPVFTLLGRFFIILFGDDPMTAANAVNFMSALASAATILFLFWTITHFARKMFVNAGEELNASQMFTVMAAGAVGALAYNFSDSFWYSAVEGEVYALSSFFTALVFWAILKWEHSDEHGGDDAAARMRSDRWIVFLFFMIGLSIGVHLLNLLTIPAIVMVYYYRRYQPTVKGAIIAFLVGCLMVGIVQVTIIQYSMKAAGLFDVFFVNSLGTPFFTGFALYFVALAAVIAWGLRFNKTNFNQVTGTIWFLLFLGLSVLPFFMVPGSSGGAMFLKFLLVAGVAAALGYVFKPSALRVLKLVLWSYTFVLLGYSLYFTALIRSNANPTIDMNNVDNPINLVYYLSREQYGSAPLVFGPHYAAQPDDIVEGEMRYARGTDKYEAVGRTREYSYPVSEQMLFPRIWDPSEDQGHARFYAQWLGLGVDREGRYEAPSYADNINWFFTYQMDLMYWRYFMWNFAGKQNDVQGLGNVRDGNWITGVSFIDNQRLGDQSKLPESLQHNKANNKLYMLPFVLGIIGCMFQFFRNRRDWVVSFLLFFFTGIAVVLYLNQPGNQPRERDYAYVGSFYAFAIWIGLAVVAFVRMAREKADKLTFQNTLLYGSALTFLITAMSSLKGSGSSIIVACLGATAIYAAVTAAVTLLLRAISGGGQKSGIVNIGAAALSLAIPVLMAQQEWDDHDRSKKVLAPDLARDYLESCDSNAIIFTFGDNDTYPLWYAQEVEGIRTDIRIINNSLLGIDWYIDQLRYKVNKADAVDLYWDAEKTRGNNRNFVVFDPKRFNQNVFEDLSKVMDYIGSNDPAKQNVSRGEPLPSFPVKKVYVNVNEALVRSNGTVNPDDSIINPMRFEIPKNSLYKNDLVILNIIAANQWKRPIYFTSPFGELGFGNYLRKDGLSYRLVPIEMKNPQQNWVIDQTLDSLSRAIRVGLGGTSIRDNNNAVMYQNLMEEFRFGGAGTKGVYFDEENRRHLLNIRAVYAEAAGNLADLGDKEKAKALLAKAEEGIDPENLPYGYVSRFSMHNQTGLQYLEAAYKAGNRELAEKVRQSVRKDIEEQRAYYQFLRLERPELFGGNLEGTESFLNEIYYQVLESIERHYGAAAPAGQTTEGSGGTIETPASNP
ncbi:MAG: protein O-mannosyl-transferase family [Chitinophagaceae bacterium]